MLPPAISPDFPLALKTARIKLNLTRCALANKAYISRKLLKRYEEPEDKHFTIPRNKTWYLINVGLGYITDNSIKNEFIPKSKIKHVNNIFNHVCVNSVITIVEEKLLQNNKSNTCKTNWQPSSPYYKS